MLNKKVKCEFCGKDLIKPGCYVPKCYIARGKEVIGLTAVMSSSDEPTLYDAVDCPICGKQLILGVRERTYVTKKQEGEWLWLGGDDLIRNHKWSCSKCGRGVKEQENYCPNCGVKMKKEENNE